MVVDLYGQFAGHVGVENDQDAKVVLRNNASRFGIRAEVSAENWITVKANAEWAIQVGGGDDRLNFSASSTGSITRVTVEPTQVPSLPTRLGWLGIDFHRYGEVRLGKTWSVYSDVSLLGDPISVFAGGALATFNAGTDGGDSGLGRANSALSYRISLGPVRLGVQTQILPGYREFDSFSGSVLFTVPCKCGLTIGSAYHHAFMNGRLPLLLPGFRGNDSQAFTASARLTRGRVSVAAAYARTENFEASSVWLPPTLTEGVPASTLLMYGTDGFRSSAQYTTEDFTLFAGHYVARARGIEPSGTLPGLRLHEGFRPLHLLLAGGSYQLFPWAATYVEGRLDLSQNAVGRPNRIHSIVAGLAFNFSSRRALTALLQDAAHDSSAAR
ncbi:MAG: porin [Polyangiaceae bacterium]